MFVLLASKMKNNVKIFLGAAGAQPCSVGKFQRFRAVVYVITVARIQAISTSSAAEERAVLELPLAGDYSARKLPSSGIT